MRKIFLSLLLLAAAPLGWAAGSKPVFTSSGTVLSSASVSDVMPIPGGTGYRMYFTSASYFVQSATSTDGVNWTVEPGMRISTTAGSLDVSSITAVTVYYNSAATHKYTMYYVGIDATGLYYILKAYSSDGVAFAKDYSSPIKLNSGLSYLGSPKAWPISSTSMLLYCVYSANGDALKSNYRAGYFTSTTHGTSFDSTPTPLLSGTTVYALAVSSITGGQVRLYAVTQSTYNTNGYQIYSWLGTNNGKTFPSSAESGTRFSTTTNTNISQLAIMRDANNWRWRLFGTMGSLTSTGTVQNLLTLSPAIETVAPSLVYQSDPSTSFAVGGEIFSSSGALTATLYNGSGSIPVTATTRSSDVSLTVSATTFAAPIGMYNLMVTDSDGNSGTFSNAVNIDYKPGNVDMYDSVYRPLKDSATLTPKGVATVFTAGRLVVRVYTTNGQKVRTVFDSPVNAGTYTVSWDGKTDSGAYAASGMYLMHFDGPKLDSAAKVVIIK